MCVCACVRTQGLGSSIKTLPAQPLLGLSVVGELSHENSYTEMEASKLSKNSVAGVQN